MKELIFVISLLFPTLALPTVNDSWRFLVIADWHKGEQFLWNHKKNAQNDSLERQSLIASEANHIARINSEFGGDFVLMPGDVASGKWLKPQFKNKFMPNSSDGDRINNAGRIVYSSVKEAFAQGGYDNLIMAVGDHELGDNNWDLRKVNSLGSYRAIFESEFTDPVRNLYGKTENFQSTDIKPYDKTTYAIRHKNTLIVTLDLFYTDPALKEIAETGIVVGDVDQAILSWLEGVLATARNDVEIKYIFVQGHLPILRPVRSIRSSNMHLRGDKNSPLWKLLEKYNVDIYFSGEVHDITVNKETSPGVIQVSSKGGKNYADFLLVDVTSFGVKIAAYRRDSNGDFFSEGEVSISDQFIVSSTGILTPIDPKKAIIHLTFDQPRTEVPDSMGRKNSTSKIETIYSNSGEFRPRYDFICNNCKKIKGVNGLAIELDETSKHRLVGSRNMSGHSQTISLFVRTTSDSNQVLLSSIGRKRKKLVGQIFALYRGTPRFTINEAFIKPASDVKVNDGNWHHLLISYDDESTIDDLELYVDGIKENLIVSSSSKHLVFGRQGNNTYSIGGFDGKLEINLKKYDLENYRGSIDEFSIWPRKLSSQEILRISKLKN